MRPAARSTHDILAWLKAEDWPSRQTENPTHMIRLLYLAQALYAASHKQRKLMPATFLATVAGPMEPDIFLALDSGVTIRSPLKPSPEVVAFLRSFHATLRDFGKAEMDILLAKDTALRTAMARGRNSEITTADMAAAYSKGIPAITRETGGALRPPLSRDGRSDLDAAPNEKQEVRFTADGRSVTRWVPKRRITSEDQPILN